MSAKFLTNRGAVPQRSAVGGWLNLLALLLVLGASTSKAACLAPPAGLVGFWTGDGHAFDVVDGTAATLRNGCSFGPGLVGGAFQFSGSSQYVQVGNLAKLQMTTQFTLEAWIFPTGTSDSVIVTKEGEYELARFGDGTIRWAVAASSPGWTVINSGYVAPTNTWTHVAWVFNQGTNWLYGNGALVQTYEGSGNVGDAQTGYNEFWIGGRQNGGQYFKGTIDEVSVYSRAISAGEVGSIYAAGFAGKCRPLCPERSLSVVSVSEVAGRLVEVPVAMRGLGDENALSFSLSFDPTRVTYVGEFAGAGAAGVSLMANSSQLSSGRIGYALAKAAGQLFAAGSNELVRVRFLLGSQPGAVALNFGDSPLPRETVNAEANALCAAYASGTATILALAGPTVVTAPQSRTIQPVQGIPTNVTFTVTAGGSTPLAYQWRFNSSAIPGATASAYTVTNTTSVNGGSYDVVVTNDGGTVTSPAATLTVLPPVIPPVVVSQPRSQVVSTGETVILTVSATGTAPLRYQWTKGGANIANATDAALAMVNVTTAAAGTYAVKVSNDGGTANSQNATVTVSTSVRTVRVVDRNAATGGAIDVPVELVGLGDENAVGFSVNFDPGRLIYQGIGLGAGTAGGGFLVNSNELAFGRLGVALTRPAGQAFAAGTNQLATLRFRASDTSGEAPLSFGDQPVRREIADVLGNARAAIFRNGTVNILATAPAITVQPQSTNAPIFSRVVLQPEASGSVPLSYQWQRDGVDLAGATLPSLTLDNVLPFQAGGYRLTVINAAGAATSSVATVTVPRVVRLRGTNGPTGNLIEMPVEMLCAGDENAAGFSLNYNPAEIVAVGVVPGTSLGTGSLNWNTNQSGRVGIALARSDNGVFAFGTQQVASVQFLLGQNAGSRAVTFGDQPIVRELVDRGARPLATDYQPAVAVGYAAAPTITQQPLAQTAWTGNNAAFSVGATGTKPMGYQWLRNGTAISGATASLFTITNVQPSDAGNYAVQVSNSVGTTASATALLTVLEPRLPPVLINIAALPLSSQCTITWQTDEPARSQVEYGTSASYGSSTAPGSQLLTSHVVTLSGLSPVTTYHYRIHVVDGFAQETISEDLTFVTRPDTTAPQTVLGSALSVFCSVPVSLSWSGSDDVTAAGALGFSYRLDAEAWSSYTTAHSASYPQLSEGPHVFQVKARDAAGNEDATPASLSFSLDTTPPQISAVAAAPEQARCEVKWQTDEPGTSQVEYGLTAAYGQMNALNSFLSSTHSQMLTGLVPNTNYHYRVRSRDACGHETVSADRQFALLPTADLRVLAVSTPADAWSDIAMDVSWTLTNASVGTAMGPWRDRLYLSADDQLQINTDQLLGEFQYVGNLEPGQTLQRVQSVVIQRAGIAEGAYKVLVVADAGDAVPEGAGETNNAAVSPAISVHINPWADLVVSAECPPSGVGGQTINLTWVTCNNGLAATDVPLWYDHVYLSPTTNKADAIRDYGEFANPAFLGAGECYLQSTAIQLPIGIGGPYYFIVETDSKKQLREESEANNLGCTPIPINIQLVRPGFLHVESVQVAPAPPTSVWAGEPVTVTFVVRNTGESAVPASSWDHAFAFCTPPALDCTPTYWHLAPVSRSLAPGEAYTNTLALTVPATLVAGTYNLAVVIDPIFRLGNVGRDLGGAPIAVIPAPPSDLELTAVAAPGSAYPGQAITVAWTVANNGNAKTPSTYWYDAVYLSTNSEFHPTQSRLLGTAGHWGSMDLSEVYGRSLPVTLPAELLPPGIERATNYLFVVTDVGNSITESSDANNVLAAPEPLVIEPFAPADLAVTSVDASGTLVAGRAATFSWSVTNYGPGITTATGWSDALYLSSDPFLDPGLDFLVGTVNHAGSLPPGAGYTQTSQLTIPACATGQLYLLVLADSGHKVNEAGAVANNLATSTAPIAVLPSPAARLQVLALTAPSTVQAGTSLTVSWTVVNHGNDTTASWADALFLSPGPEFDRTNAFLLGSYPHSGGLARAESYTQVKSAVVPRCFAGPFYVHVVADSANVVNSLSCETGGWRGSDNPVAISPADYPSLQVAALSVPASVDSGAPWSIYWTVTNAGPGAAAGTWWDAIYASPRPELDTTAALLARFEHNLSLASHGVYSEDRQVAFPPCVSGSLYLFVTTDLSNSVNAAACQTNNTARSVDTVQVQAGSRPDLGVSGLEMPLACFADQPFTISWVVTNAGTATAGGMWHDSVFLSTNAIFDPQRSILLGTFPRSAVLDPSAAYTTAPDLVLPPDSHGSFHVVIVADVSNVVEECSWENNNVYVSAERVLIVPVQYPNLELTRVEAPGDAFSGQNIAVSWIVRNSGTGTSGAGVWYDALYLSKDQVLDAYSDIKLGTFARPAPLAAGQEYTNLTTVLVPPSASGAYYVIAVADSGGNLYEYIGEDANSRASASILVTMPAPADLVASDVTVGPAAGLPDQPVTIRWTVRNNSANPVPATWTDAIYLSTNTVWDINAVQVARRDHSGLAAGGAYTDSWTGPLPALTPGSYHAIARADVRSSVRDADRANNDAASTGTVTTDVQTLTLGEPHTNQLNTGSAQYYKVSVPAGETLRVTLDSSSQFSANELFLRFEAVPDLGHYDLAYQNVAAPDQQIQVPTTQAGWYYVMVRGANVPDAPASYTIRAEIVPFAVESASTRFIGDNGQVTLILRGAKFETGAAVRLLGANAAYTAERVVFTDSTTARARFQFTNAVRGQYDLVLVNPGDRVAQAPERITIEEARPLQASAWNGIVDLLPRQGLPFRWDGFVQNVGNVDVPYLTTSVVLSQPFPMTVTPPAQATGSADLEDNSTFTVRDVPPGEAFEFAFTVTDFASQDFVYYIRLKLETKSEFLLHMASLAEEMRQGILVSTNASTLPPELSAPLATPESWAAYFGQGLAMAGLIDIEDQLPQAKDWTTVPGKGARSRAKDAESCVFSCYVEHDRAFDLIVTWYAAKSVQCLLKKPQEGPLCAAKLVLQLTIKLRDLSQKTDKCVEKCFCMDDPICGMPTGPNPPSSRSGGAPGMARAKSGETCDSSASSGHVCPPAPRDPNEKDGPAGYSTEAFVGVQQPWLYTIHFENVSNATAYARQVFVTDKMDPNLDLRTFRLREVAFGDVVITVPTNRSFFQTRVPLPAPHASNIVADVSAGVDLGKGEVFWTINAIDLTTGELVANALEGILPPNDATHRGEGYVVYTVKPKASANTGTVVTNQARIVFDTNEPIDTNPTRHTVDAVAPTSTVGVLPAIAMETNFPVSWAGTDDQGGAGLATYDIYVSDNSGPWQVWLSSTAGIGAIFNGQPGHQYAFFSRARDHASNLEPLPAGLQAATVVSNNRAPSLAVIPNQTATVGQDLALQLSASDPDEPAGFTFDLLDCPTGASIDSKQGILHWVPQSWQAATTNLITVQVRDHGFPPKSASQSFLVVVDDYTELTVNGGTFLAGQSGCLPVRLISTRALANLSFVLSFPVERLQNLAASPAGTDISQARLGLIAPGQALITLSAAPGATLKGTQEVASVCFQAVPGQASGVVPLGIGQLSARTPDGATVQPAGFLGGSLTIIGTQPLLELAGTAINQVEIIVHGYPGKTYVVETASDLHGPWSPGSSFTLSTVTQLMSWPIGTDRIRFLRVREQPGLRTREATEITNGE